MKRYINSIINDNCITVMSNIPDNFFNHIITDIPYSVINRKNNGIRNLDKGEADILNFDLKLFLDESIRISKDKIFIFCSSEQVSEIYNHFISKNLFVNMAIWEKSNPSPMNGQYLWLSGVECCVIAERNQSIIGVPIWNFSVGRSKEHPTEKPSKLLEHIIETYTKVDDHIYDPCFGSGSTLIASIKLNRRYFGTELSNEYFKLAERKLLNFNHL